MKSYYFYTQQGIKGYKMKQSCSEFINCKLSFDDKLKKNNYSRKVNYKSSENLKKFSGFFDLQDF